MDVNTELINYELKYPKDFLLHLLQFSDEDRTSVPFDILCEVIFNPYNFGCLGDGPRIGRWAKLKNKTVKLPTLNSYLDCMIGQIVGDLFGRVVLFIEDGFYIGWLNPNDYDLIDIDRNDSLWTN